MSKEQRRMMDDKEKLLKEAANPLTYLFRKVLLELGVEAKPWNRRLTAFLSSPLSRVPKNAKDIGQERNNFNRAIAKKEITFKTFQKAVQILGPQRYSMSITMIMRDGREVKIATEMFKNPYSAIDDLAAAIHGKGLSPDADIADYTEDDDDSVTDEAVEEMIQQIESDDRFNPVDIRQPLKRPDPDKRSRLSRLFNKDVSPDNSDND
jgi:hypothetical protein